MILVGIDDFVERPDLRDRAVFLHLPPIPRTSRRSERGFWPAFRADYPRILGGLLDAMAGGLRELPSVDLKELPRMADFAEWGEAVGRGLGWGANSVPRDLQRQPQGSDRPDPGRLAAWRPCCWRSQRSKSTGRVRRWNSIKPPSREPARNSGPVGPRRSTRSAPNCAGSHPSFDCTDFPFTLNGKVASVWSC